MSDQGQPGSVSVVIPTFNRDETLAGCLRALGDADYPAARLEIIVVDDGGDAPIDDVIARAGGELPIRLVRQPHRGAAAARNHGVRIAEGSIVAFLDDDCRPVPGWLSALVATLEESPDALVGGQTENVLLENPFAEVAQLIVNTAYEHQSGSSPQDAFFASNNMAVARAALREAGGFDEGFRVHACEDRELCDRWRKRGLPLRFVPEALVLHAHPHTLASFCSQYFAHGRGAYHYHRLRRARALGGLTRGLSNHMRLSSRLMASAIDGARPPRAQTLALLGAFEVTNLSGFVYELLTRRGYSDGEP